MAEQTSHGIGSWWEFRPDGTFTMQFGAMSTTPVTHSGNTLSAPSPKVAGQTDSSTFRIEGNKLYLKHGSGAEVSYMRDGPAPSAADPLLGKWLRILPAASEDPVANSPAALEAMRKLMVVFSADGTQSVRIPFTIREGTWNAHSFQFKGEATTHAYHRVGRILDLSPSSDTQQPETFVPDPIP
jgi:hypothetical protein